MIAYERTLPRADAPDPGAEYGGVTAIDSTAAALGNDLDRDVTDEGSAMAGSLFSIEFRQQGTESEARASQNGTDPTIEAVPGSSADRPLKGKAAFQKLETERRRPLRFSTPTDQAGGTAEPAGPAPILRRNRRGDGSHYRLMLALVTVSCLMIGTWFALEHWGGNATQALDPAVPPAASAGAAPGGQAGAGESAKAAAPLSAVEPSFDIIRVEPDGQAVIAGRAAPNAELILLDNGEPIGAVTADWAGEWAFIPETALEPGNHQFSLVVNTPQETVTLPEPREDTSGPRPQGQDEHQIRLDTPKPAQTPRTATVAPGGRPDQEEPNEEENVKPASARSTDAKPMTDVNPARSDAKSDQQSSISVQDPPAPPHKPSLKELAILGGGGTTHYMIQLSSTPSQTGARKEWVKLRRVFPDLLDGMVLNVQKANVDPWGIRYRVRTGQFVDQGRARALCQKFQSLDQECLVIKR